MSLASARGRVPRPVRPPQSISLLFNFIEPESLNASHAPAGGSARVRYFFAHYNLLYNRRMHAPAVVTLHEVACRLRDALASPITRAMYSKAINDFLAWHGQQGSPALSRPLFEAYRAHLQTGQYSTSSINQRLCAIRKLIAAAWEQGLLKPEQALLIMRVHGLKPRRVRLANWLSAEQAQALVNAPDPSSPKGVRDRAILALLVGCGLLRTEVVAIERRHLERREGRWVLLDIEGKHGRTRTVPVPPWVKSALDEWLARAPIDSGKVFRAVERGGFVTARAMGAHSIFELVKRYGEQLGLRIRPQDLRRTCARLCRREGAELEQIQLLLGHSSIQITEQYLGTTLQIAEAPNDRIPVRWQGRSRRAS